jgi:radical SAM protein with 4Fe4S-binding SPASM domain
MAKKIRYDERGGIISLEKKFLEEPGQKGKNKVSYSLLERLMLRFSKKINYLLDKDGKYKCRNEKTPSVIRIGPTNRCTAQCAYCPREHIHARGSGYLDFALYEELIAWAKAKGVKTISFALFGEPLLHPRIFEMFALAKANGLETRLSTNAIIMDQEKAERILAADFVSIEMSLDGFSEKEYQAGKKVDRYEKAKSNIEYLLKRAREMELKSTFNIHFVDNGNVSRENKKNFVKYWKKALSGLRYETSFYYEPHNWAGTRPDISQTARGIDRFLSRFELKKPCIYIKGLNIDWDGSVYICTNDPTEKAIIGNIKKESIEEIYNGQKRLSFLEAHEKGDFREKNCAVCNVNSYWPLLFLKKKLLNFLAK